MERYEACKDSGVEWIGEIPVGWEVRRVMTMLDRSGFGMKVGPFGSAIKDKVVEKGPYKMYGQANLIKRDFSYGDKFVNQSTYQELAAYDVAPWDVLVSVMGTIGKCSVVPPGIQPGIMDSHLIKLRLSEECIPRFFEYAYESDGTYEQLRCMSKGSIMNGLNSEMVKSVRLAVPVLTEQQAIADYLDARTAEIDALVADCEREVELLREYRKAVISEAVTKGLDPDAPMRDSGIEWIGEIPKGWEISRVGWVGVCLNGDRGVNYPSGEDMLDEGVPFVVTDALHGDTIDPERCKYISSERYELLSGVKLQLNDIAYCLRGSVGTCSINNFANEGTVASSLMVIRPKATNTNWLYYALTSGVVSRQVESYMNGTCAANLSADGVSKFRLPLPSSDEQQLIAEYLDAKTAEIDSLIESKLQMAEKLREYRKSLISEAVTGKFKVPGVK